MLFSVKQIKRNTMLQSEFQYYLDNQKEIVEKYNGKHIVIKNKQVQGAYDSFEIALSEATKKFELGTFIIQLCTPGEEAYTQTYHSRVIFA